MLLAICGALSPSTESAVQMLSLDVRSTQRCLRLCNCTAVSLKFINVILKTPVILGITWHGVAYTPETPFITAGSKSAVIKGMDLLQCIVTTFSDLGLN